MDVTKEPEFEILDNQITYVSHPHIGFDPGVSKSKKMDFSEKTWSFTGYFDMPYDTRVATFAAGFTIVHGKFRKKIFNQILVSDGDWADPIAADELISGFENRKSSRPRVSSQYRLYQNYPNPFNGFTKIRFYIPVLEKVSLVLYDVLGQKVQTLLDHTMSAGEHEMEFDSRGLASGIYYYRLQAGVFRGMKKLILLR
jgi:hypothetical protein